MFIVRLPVLYIDFKKQLKDQCIFFHSHFFSTSSWLWSLEGLLVFWNWQCYLFVTNFCFSQQSLWRVLLKEWKFIFYGHILNPYHPNCIHCISFMLDHVFWILLHIAMHKIELYLLGQQFGIVIYNHIYILV